jgi:Na+/melibiose symporter-like transporter
VESHRTRVEPEARLVPAFGTRTRHVPTATRILFGSGSMAEGAKNTAFNVFLLFYFNQVLGISGTLGGAAIFIALLVDAVTDPMVGSISDRFRSPWGRRHPFMYTAALPMAASFYALFNPPALSEVGLFLWLCAFAIGVRGSMTLFMIPSSAMLPELTPNYDERTSLVSYRFLFGWLGGLSYSLLAYQVMFAPSERFADGRLDPEAYGTFALAGAALILFAILSCSLGTHHLIPRLTRPAEDARASLSHLLGDLRTAFSNRSYLMLVIGLLFAAVAGGFNDVVGLYMNAYFWGLTTDQLSILVLGLIPAPFLAFALTPGLSLRFDKKSSATGLALFAFVFGPLPIYLRLFEWMPENGSPWLLYVLVPHATILVTIAVAIGILISSMVADVVDENELRTGERQEGIFSSAIAFTSKAVSGVGGFLAGLALDLIAFPRGVAVEAVPADKVFLLGLAVGPGMMVLFLLTLIFLSRYSITRETHAEIRAALAARHLERQAASGP